MTGTIESDVATVLEACRNIVPASTLVWVRCLDSDFKPESLVRVLAFYGIAPAVPSVPLVKRQDWDKLRDILEHFDELWLVHAGVEADRLRDVGNVALTTDCGRLDLDTEHSRGIERIASICGALAGLGDGDGLLNYFAADEQIRTTIKGCDEAIRP